MISSARVKTRSGASISASWENIFVRSVTEKEINTARRRTRQKARAGIQNAGDDDAVSLAKTN
jgi:hypothetical protein